MFILFIFTSSYCSNYLTGKWDAEKIQVQEICSTISAAFSVVEKFTEKISLKLERGLSWCIDICPDPRFVINDCVRAVNFREVFLEDNRDFLEFGISEKVGQVVEEFKGNGISDKKIRKAFEEIISRQKFEEEKVYEAQGKFE